MEHNEAVFSCNDINNIDDFDDITSNYVSHLMQQCLDSSMSTVRTLDKKLICGLPVSLIKETEQILLHSGICSPIS